jgi:hypothetical protein
MKTEVDQVPNSICSLKLREGITSRCIKYINSNNDNDSLFICSGSNNKNIYMFVCNFNEENNTITSNEIFNYDEYIRNLSISTNTKQDNSENPQEITSEEIQNDNLKKNTDQLLSQTAETIILNDITSLNVLPLSINGEDTYTICFQAFNYTQETYDFFLLILNKHKYDSIQSNLIQPSEDQSRLYYITLDGIYYIDIDKVKSFSSSEEASKDPFYIHNKYFLEYSKLIIRFEQENMNKEEIINISASLNTLDSKSVSTIVL